MENNRQAEYIYISNLDSATSAYGTDLLVVSQLSGQDTQTGQDLYVSKKLQYQDVKDDMYSYISATMSSATDMHLLSSVDSLSSIVSGMADAVDVCLSACVALDYCRNKVLASIEWLSSYIDEKLSDIT